MKTNIPTLLKSLDRRSFLRVSSAFGLAGMAARPALGIARAKSFANDPFSLGVASGDPSSDGFVLWTRLAPDPLNGDAESPIGRGRTTPKMDTAFDKLRFSFASCQHYETGYYHAYRDMIAHSAKRIQSGMCLHSRS